ILSKSVSLIRLAAHSPAFEAVASRLALSVASLMALWKSASSCNDDLYILYSFLGKLLISDFSNTSRNKPVFSTGGIDRMLRMFFSRYTHLSRSVDKSAGDLVNLGKSTKLFQGLS